LTRPVEPPVTFCQFWHSSRPPKSKPRRRERTLLEPDFGTLIDELPKRLARRDGAISDPGGGLTIVMPQPAACALRHLGLRCWRPYRSCLSSLEPRSFRPWVFSRSGTQSEK
jgi:hypothetical protein